MRVVCTYVTASFPYGIARRKSTRMCAYWQCIFLRNTTATDDSDYFPYDTSGFKNINQQQYMFFVQPDDLMNLDIANGMCYNNSVKQNLTFGYQGLPFGLHTGNGQSGSGKGAAGRMSGWSTVVGAVVAMVAFMWL